MSHKSLRTVLGDQFRRPVLGRLSRRELSNRRRLRPALLDLERRQLLATFTVSNTYKSGPGSLAAAVASANGNNQANTIDFSFTSPESITLGGSALVLTDTGGTQTITGPLGGVTISGGNLSRVFEVASGVVASFSGLTISGGKTSQNGGGLYNDLGMVSLSNCTISGNSAGYGGGLYNSGTMILTDCTISGNSAQFAAAGLGNNNNGTAILTDCTIADGNAQNQGGGLCNYGTVSLAGCTISGNSASDLAGGLYNGGSATVTDCTISGNSAEFGGGLDNGNGVIATLTLTDCTISGNSAGKSGGGLYNLYSNLTLTACTITGNAAGRNGGGLFTNATPSSASLTDTIVAGNTTSGESRPSDIDNTGTISGTYNLIGTGGAGAFTNGNDHNIVLSSLSTLDLAPLAFYGGPTETMALLPGSAAIGAGSASVSGVTIPTTDQRGFALDDTSVDIGAFQVQTGGAVVDTPADGTACPSGMMDLRGAIDRANILATAQPITFGATFFPSSPMIILTAGPLELSNTSVAETITALATGLTISGGGASSVFQVESGVTATLSGLTITGGSASLYGGGVYNQGSTTLTDCTISNNTAGATGGGLENRGKLLSLVDCTISGNSARYAGGGLNNYVAATLKMVACTVSGNSAAAGGGVCNYAGSATLTDTIVAGNTTEGSSTPLDITGTVSGSYNLIGPGGSGGLTNNADHNIVLASLTSLGLAPLGWYGGPIETMALLPKSRRHRRRHRGPRCHHR